MYEDHLTPPPCTLPQAESVTSEAGFCHLAETSVTSTKMIENNELTEVCHRSINTHSDVVTSEKNGARARRSKAGGTVSDYEATATDAQWKRDCLTLTATKLKERYPGTYQAYHAMMYVRALSIEKGGEGAIIHDNVASLAKFMRALGGPRRHVDRTVDRIDRLDHEYSADKIVWDNKTGQARNRETNSIVTNPQTGEEATVAEVAECVGIKANTLTKALNRAIAKNPDREAEIRRTIVAKQLAKLPGHTDSPAPVTPEEAAPAVEPYTKRTQPHDWRARWPVEMPKDMRDQWEQMLKNGRRVVNEDTGELEWRHEFYIRTIRGVLHAGGYGGNMIGREPAPGGTKLEKMRRAWVDEEDPTEEELSAYTKQEDIFTRCVARLGEAMAVLPEFEAEARQTRRDRDRSYPRFGRQRPSRDYEDEETKDAEGNGTAEDETEAAPDADNWREELAMDHAARRRGMEL